MQLELDDMLSSQVGKREGPKVASRASGSDSGSAGDNGGVKVPVFSDLELASLVCLLYALARADGVAADEERDCLNRIFFERGISSFIVEVGKMLEDSVACKVVAHMDAARKIIVGVHLREIMDCDEHGDEPPEVEMLLFNRYLSATGIDTVFREMPEL